jgi:hypothetical protein
MHVKLYVHFVGYALVFTVSLSLRKELIVCMLQCNKMWIYFSSRFGFFISIGQHAYIKQLLLYSAV